MYNEMGRQRDDNPLRKPTMRDQPGRETETTKPDYVDDEPGFVCEIHTHVFGRPSSRPGSKEAFVE